MKTNVVLLCKKIADVIMSKPYEENSYADAIEALCETIVMIAIAESHHQGVTIDQIEKDVKRTKDVMMKFLPKNFESFPTATVVVYAKAINATIKDLQHEA